MFVRVEAVAKLPEGVSLKVEALAVEEPSIYTKLVLKERRCSKT
jgi:hypothetical protein